MQLVEQVCVRVPTSAVNVTLLAFAAAKRLAAVAVVDICCRHGAQQQTRRTPWVQDGTDGADGQTDRRMDGRPSFIDTDPRTRSHMMCGSSQRILC